MSDRQSPARLITVLLFLIAGSLPAQDTTTPDDLLTELKTELKEEEKKLQTPIAEFQGRYAEQLHTLKKKAQADGDLEQILAVETEIQSIPAGGSEIPAQYQALARLRKLYDDHVAVLEKQKNQKYKRLLTGHREKLRVLQGDLTRAGKIDQALQVKFELESVTAAIAEGRAPSRAGVVGAPGNRTPGKLVVGGTYEDGSPLTLSDEQQKEQYVRVAAGHDRWLALEASGKVTARLGVQDYLTPPKSAKDIVDIHCGRHMDMLQREDGTVIPLGGNDQLPHVPDVEPGTLAGISLGHSKNVFLMKDGTILPFGYSFAHENITFPRDDLSSDVVEASVGTGPMAIRKSDGSLHLVSIRGEDMGGRPATLEGEEIQSVEVGLNHGPIILTKKGKVISWNSHEPPADLRDVIRIRAGSNLCAAQREDRTWVIWGGHQGVVAALNQRLEELGPLKDLAVGSRFFVAVK